MTSVCIGFVKTLAYFTPDFNVIAPPETWFFRIIPFIILSRCKGIPSDAKTGSDGIDGERNGRESRYKMFLLFVVGIYDLTFRIPAINHNERQNVHQAAGKKNQESD